jgi:hypothetical protein
MGLEKLTQKEAKFLDTSRKWMSQGVILEGFCLCMVIVFGSIFVTGLFAGESFQKVFNFNSQTFNKFCLYFLLWLFFFVARRERRQFLTIIDKLAN